MAIATKAHASTTSQWHRQILRHRNPQAIAARSRFVVTSFIDQAGKCSALVDINRLLVVLLYEDPVGHRCSPRPNGSPLRFAGYRVTRVPHGIQWGGATNSQFFKDLTLAPRARGRSQRLDCGQTQMVDLAAGMDRRLARAGRHPNAPWPKLRLPRVWAGFRVHSAHALRGDGPEFELACCDAKTASALIFERSKRMVNGIALHPLEWVSSKLDQAVAVYAELTPSLRRQVFRIESGLDSLVGYQGASEFDFYHSRFRKLAIGESAKRLSPFTKHLRFRLQTKQ
jgi:hypothetical protein